jgi:uncharacterized protein
LRPIRPGACAITALWPLIAIARGEAAVPPPIDQVSADCTAPTYTTDQLVCADPALRAHDDELARLWAHAEATGRLGASVQEAQADWFRQRRLRALREDHRACADAAYRARIAELKRHADG